MEPAPPSPIPDKVLRQVAEAVACMKGADAPPPAGAPPDSGLLRPSVFALVAANLVPVYGALFLGWETLPILLLFWVENVIIGLFNALKMLCAGQGHLLKFILVPFFCVHYGMFTFVHGVFVMGFFGGAFRQGSPFPDERAVMEVVQREHLGWAIVGLFLSHALSFVLNYLRGGEYRQANPAALMRQPYGRVVVMHLTILLGAFLIAALKTPSVALVLLVVLKVVLDVRSHLHERRKFSLPAIPGSL
jgi:hypothetical protein